MKFQSTAISGVYLVDLEEFEDERGGFSRTFCLNEFKTIGFEENIVQINHSYNKLKGTIRGLHFQKPPFSETKIIRCVRGKVADVVVDIRRDSVSYLNHLSVELSDRNRKMIVVPHGCAHGFQTLENNSELIYHHTAFYNPQSESGIKYNDPRLNIQWPVPVSLISAKDSGYSLIDSKFEGV